jgi:hypothetical protein
MSEQQNQNDGQNKVAKEFEENIKKLHGILGTGKATFKQLTSNQLGNGEIASIIAELTKEREEKAAEDFKREMALILDETVEYRRHVKKLQKEMEEKIAAKQKDMNAKFKALFNKVENVKQYRQDATDALHELASESTEASGEKAD